VLGACRLNDIDPLAHVRDVLTRLADGWLQSRVSGLLPPDRAWLHGPPAEARGETRDDLAISA